MCHALASECQQRGHEVALFVFQSGKVKDEFEKAGIKVFTPDFSDSIDPDRFTVRRVAKHGLEGTVRQWKPSLIHSHTPITNLICNKLLKNSIIPWIATIHGSWKQFGYAPETVSKPYLKPYLIVRHVIGSVIATTSAKRIIAPSNYVKRSLCQIGVSPQRISVVINGIPLRNNDISREQARSQLGAREHHLLIGSIGYFAPVKGFDLLIKAVSRLRKRGYDIKLFIAGGDVMGNTTVRENLQKLIESEQISNEVHLLGELSSTRLFLSALDVFVVASRTEALSLALVESMQYGLPSVVTSEGGPGEAARDGVESIVFQSGNVKDLADKLETLLNNPSMREAMGRAAAARASTYLTLSRCTDEYEKVYHEVVKGSQVACK